MQGVDWTQVLESGLGVIGALTIIAGVIGSVEKIWGPIRKLINKYSTQRKYKADVEKRTIALLEKMESHFEDANERDRRITRVEDDIKEIKSDVEDSKAERRILWAGVHAILSALKQIVPDNPDIEDALRDMDDYANERIRQ